jgi:hypothetical protein
MPFLKLRGKAFVIFGSMLSTAENFKQRNARRTGTNSYRNQSPLCSEGICAKKSSRPIFCFSHKNTQAPFRPKSETRPKRFPTVKMFEAAKPQNSQSYFCLPFVINLFLIIAVSQPFGLKRICPRNIRQK